MKAYAYAGQISRLQEPKHGIVTGVKSRADSFLNRHPSLTRTIAVTHYHSLHVKLESFDRSSIWATCGLIEPIAWDLDDEENGPVLEAVQISGRPFYGVQFHPESICTADGDLIIKEWWSLASAWLKANIGSSGTRKQSLVEFLATSRLPGPTSGIFASRAAARIDFTAFYPALGDQVYSRSIPCGDIHVNQICDFLHVADNEVVLLESGVGRDGSMLYPHTGQHSIIGMVTQETAKIAYYMRSQLLEITEGGIRRRARTVPDAWTYLDEWMSRMKMSAGDIRSPFWSGLIGYVSYEAGLKTGLHIDPLTKSTQPIHSLTQPDMIFAAVARSIVVDHARRLIFVQSILKADEEWVSATTHALQELIERKDEIEYQSMWWPPHPLAPSEMMDGAQWAAALEMRGSSATEVRAKAFEYVLDQIHSTHKSGKNLNCPVELEYCDKVDRCDEQIRAGNSYELCLTDRSLITVSTALPDLAYSWLLYRGLMSRNCSPFAAYLRLKTLSDEVTIVGSSPERFLSWNREGLCQFRPVKGTVKKAPNVSLQQATAILRSPKEMAENLMIVDLVRHDLYQVSGSSNVCVPQLFGIEEYMTVYQLVSVIQGYIPMAKQPTLQRPTSSPASPTIDHSARKGNSIIRRLEVFSKSKTPKHVPTARRASESSTTGTQATSTSGLSILRSSLPPGSMTGAPKLRSCQILQTLEQRPRGIYSGVLGYLDVGGGGDFSVVIRTAYKWTSDTRDGKDTWTVGAGGAVTAKSTAKGEYDEMVVKANTVLKAFGVESE